MSLNINRRKTRQVTVGKLKIGSDGFVSVQSMANKNATDIDSCVRQALQLEEAGCDIFRFAIPNFEAVSVFHKIKHSGSTMPLVADIHFDYKLAVECAYAGADKIRINPGNIGGEENIKEVIKACRANALPIRIGVNSGSLEKDILRVYGSPTAEALVESAQRHVKLLEKFDFYDIIVSIKASDPITTIKANRLFAHRSDIPLHLGVTEAGSTANGTLKSAIALGSLLSDGIGDTVRVSLTAQPQEEILAARNILKAIGYAKNGINLVSCPTCGRTQVDLIACVNEFESRAKTEILTVKPLKVAIMGCAVNGPGEAREADIGVACGKGEALLIKKGEIIKKISEHEIINELIAEINKM